MAHVNTKAMVEEEMEMNMTPMIDVVFLLIIFFLCIDFRVLEAKLPAYLPKDSGTQTTETEPIEKLSLKIKCTQRGEQRPRKPNDDRSKSYFLVGHEVMYHVGPIPVRGIEKLVSELQKIFDDKTKWQTDRDTGRKKPMTVVIEPGEGATYGDVAEAVDAVNKVGFEEIQFGGGMGATKR